jgi:chemotaxis protein histidine kinase CheA
VLFRSLFAVFALAMLASASVYEAESSEDVSFFLQHNPDENSAIMFYDPFQEENNPKIVEDVEKIVGVFLNFGEKGRSRDAWVDSLMDKSHLMRVDSLNPYNADAVKDFHVTQTPFLVLLDHGNIMLEEVVSPQTYNHVRDKLDKTDQQKQYHAPVEPIGFENSATPNPYSSEENQSGDTLDKAEKSLKNAEQMSNQATQQVAQATKDLDEAKKQMQAYNEVESARKKAESAKKLADQAVDKYKKAKNELDEHLQRINPRSDASASASASTTANARTPAGKTSASASASTSTTAGKRAGYRSYDRAPAAPTPAPSPPKLAPRYSAYTGRTGNQDSSPSYTRVGSRQANPYYGTSS